jgi:hypothetical protein
MRLLIATPTHIPTHIPTLGGDVSTRHPLRAYRRNSRVSVTFRAETATP